MRTISLDFPPFGFGCFVVVGTQDEGIRFCQKHFDSSPDLADRDGFCFYSEGAKPVIWLPRFPKTPEEIATLAHEAVHAVSFFMDWRGFKWSPGDEVSAHSVDYIVRRVLEESHKRH